MAIGIEDVSRDDWHGSGSRCDARFNKKTEVDWTEIIKWDPLLGGSNNANVLGIFEGVPL